MQVRIRAWFGFERLQVVEVVRVLVKRRGQGPWGE